MGEESAFLAPLLRLGHPACPDPRGEPVRASCERCELARLWRGICFSPRHCGLSSGTEALGALNSQEKGALFVDLQSPVPLG